MAYKENRSYRQYRLVRFNAVFSMFGVVFSVCLAGGCRDRGAAPSAEAEANAPIVVSNSYLEAAIRDVLPRDVRLVRLAGPSMCPGHFDMRPSQLAELSRCRLLVRFDFQQSFDAKFKNRAGEPLSALSVHLPGGMCVPDTYLAACRQITDHFVDAGELERTEADRRLAEITHRMTALANTVRQRIDDAGIRDLPVLHSGHQTEFCRWLGLRAVAVFSAGDTAGTAEIDLAVKAGDEAGVRLIVANQPEGRRLADALAERLDAKVVVFANFPDPDKEPAFDELVRGNLAILLETCLWKP